jgi:hypothetical protein
LSNTYSNQNINSLKNKNEYIQTKQSKIKNDLNMTAKSEYPVNKNNTYLNDHSLSNKYCKKECNNSVDQVIVSDNLKSSTDQK